MPYLSLPNRRTFLAGAFAAPVLAAAQPEVRWAFLSDTHIAEDPAETYRGFRTYDNLSRTVEQVSKAAPAGAVIDGDLARMKGEPGDYLQLKSLLDPLTSSMPVGLVLGNHDDRDNFLRAFSEDPGERHFVKNKYVLSLEAGPVRLVLLDSRTATNVTPGLLGKAQRTWLDTYLGTAPPKPTMLFVHHTLDDGDTSLHDVLWLYRIVRPHRSVKAIVYGHSHSYKYGVEDGIHLINLPAVGYNFSDDKPVGWVEATLRADGADFRLHAIGGNTADDGKTTSLKWRS